MKLKNCNERIKNIPAHIRQAVKNDFDMKDLSELKKEYEAACNMYVNLFCKKHNLEFDGWVGNDVAGIAYCGDMYLNLHDIVWDMNSNQPTGSIQDWYWSNLENPEKSINYFSYTKGLRLADI